MWMTSQIKGNHLTNRLNNTEELHEGEGDGGKRDNPFLFCKTYTIAARLRFKFSCELDQKEHFISKKIYQYLFT